MGLVLRDHVEGAVSHGDLALGIGLRLVAQLIEEREQFSAALPEALPLFACGLVQRLEHDPGGISAGRVGQQAAQEAVVARWQAHRHFFLGQRIDLSKLADASTPLAELQ